ncbi:SDR family oxidoreductase [Paracoccus fistulariae]|uniref:SDR family oxidoreductase n=1 Tax=Paracoccus fistulariae TaxID=658446 RepID=A0ABY7SPD0_9RHOB|nr:SDR family oxidoreductase [Paracoccus fistulariae]
MEHEAHPWPGISGSRALVTGASSGLGAHFAQLLAAQGVHVFAAARRTDRVQALCDGIRDQGFQATPLELDVSSARAVEEALQGQVFDLVVNNAGVSHSCAALDLDADTLDRVIDTNVKGVFHVARATASAMRDAGQGGSIVNIASILGSRVSGHVAAYAASKGAVLQLTRALALEWARHGIRVNALSPGYIETEINRDFFATEQGQALIRRVPQRRLGQPQDLDGALMLLLSDLGRFITGADIAVDGGHLVSSL